LAQENKINAIPDANIKTLHLKPISAHECFKVSPVDARHFSQLTELRIDKDFRCLHFFAPSKLIALEKLILHNIKIADALYFIEALPNLKELDCELKNYDGWEELKSNSLTSLNLQVMGSNTLSYDCLPDFAVNMPNLTHLKVRRFELNDANNLAKLQKIQYLSLSIVNCRNQQLVIPPSPFLQHLHLLWIENLDIASMSQLHNLAELRMNYFKTTDISFLANLNNLKKLDIQNNEITDISALSQLKNLVELKISSNKFTDIAALQQLKNLTYLNISHNNLTDISALNQLKNLVQLDLSNNNITDISALSQLENLVELDLRNNNITDVSALEGLNKLREIILADNTLAVYPPLRTNIWIKRYGIANVLRNLAEPQELPALRALICSNDKDSLAIAEQILFGRGWTQIEFEQLVKVLRRD
jgi:internalin A